MLALCRLLERQGTFKGDLNSLQQLALQALMVSEKKELVALEKSRFKAMLVSAHPEFADEILKDDDEERDLDPDSYEAFDESEDHTLTAEDFTAMEELLQAIETKGYDIEEYE